MTTQEEGIEYLRVRDEWPDEARDFTPWLARNLGLLSDAVGLKLELVQEEAAVGPFSCDILAREADTGVIVAIENQLEWSDHSHFGQLLTYTAGRKARVSIWVAPDFRYEHAATLHWLNEWTRDGLRFYGVRVEYVKIGDSAPEPRLRTVVSPEGWNEDITQPQGASMSPRSQQFQEFFQPLIDQLLWEGFADRATQHFDSSGRFFPSGLREGTGYAVSLEGGNDAWVTLHIRTEDRELTNRIFDELIADRENIESGIDGVPDPEWHWNRYDREAFSSINVRRDAFIDDSSEKQKETRAWMLDMLHKFKEIFNPRLAETLRDL